MAHQYGCVMARLVTGDAYTRIKDIIREEDLAGSGIEGEPHVSILYGLHSEVSVAEVKQCLKDAAEGYLEHFLNFVKVIGISLFENENQDVLKLTIAPSHDLLLANKALLQLPNTQKFPEYVPHCTLAYLKPGAGKKYLIDRDFTVLLPVGCIEFSQPNGFKSIIK